MLVYLFGSDQYRVQQESLSQRERFFGEDTFKSTRKFDALDRGVFSWKEFRESVRDGDLFSLKRVIILENVSHLLEEEKENLKIWLEENRKIQDNSEVLCILEDVKPDKRTSVFKSLKKIVSWKEFPLLSPEDFMKYVRSFAREQFSDIAFKGRSLELLAEGCGSDLYRAKNELEKLVAHAGTIKSITEKDVQTLCSFGVYEDIFRSLEALSKGDKKNSLLFLWRQIKKGEHPIYLLTMCAYQIRTMILVGECLDKGIIMPAAIAREAKISPYVVGKTSICMRSFGLDRARKAFQMLGRMDVAVKTGKIDAGLALEEFVLRS